MRNHFKNNISLEFKEIEELNTKNPLFILVTESMDSYTEYANLDKEIIGIVNNFLSEKKNFQGKYKQNFVLTTNIKGEIKHIVLIGVGNTNTIKQFEIDDLGKIITNIANRLRVDKISLIVNQEFAKSTNTEIASLLADSLEDSSYRFNKYQTLVKDDEKPSLSSVNIFCKEPKTAQKFYEEFYRPVNKGIFLAKDLVNEPANILYPESYVNLIIEEMKDSKNINIKVLGEAEMKELGMNSLLGVGQGSHRESKLVVLEYNNSVLENSKKIALVGKGVTFDTGGISIKPALHMEQMKYDMTGSACVVGTIKALAERNAKANIIGVVALVENMPDGNAQRPGDIVKSMSGKTIEVLNTDAEGRLILADALTYVQKNFNPDLIIDLATLTGAITVALGSTYAGCFCNSDDLSEKLLESGEKVNEKLWKMPLHKDYHEAIKSDCADIANISSGGEGSSCTAAAFLEKFIDEKRDWAHLDIASVAWNKKGQKGALVSGASGFGIRLLNQFIYDNHEKK